MQDLVMELKGIRKRYGDNLVLDSIDLKFVRRQVYCIVGYNGYGKSTIAKIACGEQPFDSGTIVFEGKEYGKWTTEQAVSLGVVLISESSGLFPSQTVYQNMQYSLIRREGYCQFFLGAQKKEIVREINAFAGKYHLDFTPKTQISDLAYPDKMMAELLRAKLLHAKVLILDEIDVAMDRKYREILKDVLAEMKRSGTSILYISHKLDMVMALADVVGIIQNYRLTEVGKKDIGKAEDILNILLNSSAERVPKLNKRHGVELMSARYLERGRPCSVHLYEGEILGITGAGENDSSLIYELMFHRGESDVEIFIGGRISKDLKPQNALQNGIVFVSSEFMEHTVFRERSVCYNMLPYNVTKKVRSEKKQLELCQRYVNALGIKGKPEDMIETLSLGNQRKVFIAKSFLSCGDIYVFENPTDSIDGISKIDIYNIINELKIQGKGIMVISNDLKEIMGISDRIVIVQDKRVLGEFENNKLTSPKLERMLKQAAR